MRDQDSYDRRDRDGNYRGGSGTNSSGSGGEGTSMGRVGILMGFSPGMAGMDLEMDLLLAILACNKWGCRGDMFKCREAFQ